MERIEVWRTSDGELFLIEDKRMAEDHEEMVTFETKRNKLFEDNRESMVNHILENLKDDLKEDHSGDIDIYHMGEWGWECDNLESNPIDLCVYSTNLYDDESCIFCGGPEERK